MVVPVQIRHIAVVIDLGHHVQSAIRITVL